MGIYDEKVLPRIVNVACGMKSNRPLRQRACEDLHGRVLEIGFGSGHNVPHYPPAVTGVAAIEPAALGWKLARKRLEATRVPVERTGLDGQSLPLPDHSCDTALSTWTMCTIPDIAAALQEVRRVLKPGGTLHFVEHGLAPDEKVRRTQHRIRRVPPHPRHQAARHRCRLHDRGERVVLRARGPEVPGRGDHRGGRRAGVVTGELVVSPRRSAVTPRS
jgi:SAM-dependent methyltransferase